MDNRRKSRPPKNLLNSANNNESWWKLSGIPRWFGAILLVIVSYVAKAAWEDVIATRREMIAQLQTVNARMVATEAHQMAMVETLREMKATMTKVTERLTEHERQMRTPSTLNQ